MGKARNDQENEEIGGEKKPIASWKKNGGEKRERKPFE